MAGPLISPNWHVILIHYPLGLLTLGVLIELFSVLWRRSTFRVAGRWMILMGALLAIPTATVGLYAFRQVAVPGIEPADGQWHQVVQENHWTARQWEMMKDHIWLTSSATAVFVFVVVVWLAASERRRHGFLTYGLLMLLLLIGLGLLATGAWYGGEAVFRYGTAVALPDDTAGSVVAVEPASPAGRLAAGLHWCLPPLQLHLALAGLAVASCLAALGMSIKRWDRLVSSDLSGFPSEPAPASPPSQTEAGSAPAPRAEPLLIRPRVFPARFWLLGMLLAVLAALAGVWSVGGLSWPEARAAVMLIRNPDETRLFWHVVLGAALIVLPVVLAVIVRFSREGQFITGMLALVFLLAVAGQIWLGTLMLYDSDHGPISGFNPAPPPASVPTVGTSRF